MGAALPAAHLGEQDIALSPQCGEVLLERAHSLPNLAQPALELGFVKRAEVVWHGHECTAPGVFQLRC
jgi:hypothetical protein